MNQALQVARPGSMFGYVGAPHGVQFDGQSLFFAQVGMLGGPPRVRGFLPHLMDPMLARKIYPGKVFDLRSSPHSAHRARRSPCGGLCRSCGKNMPQCLDSAASLDHIVFIR